MGTGVGRARQRDGKGHRDKGWPVTALLGLFLLSSLATAGIFLVGCSVMRSDSLDDPNKTSGFDRGMAYSIPKGYLHIAVTSTISIVPVAQMGTPVLATPDNVNTGPIASWSNSSTSSSNSTGTVTTVTKTMTLSGTNSGPAIPTYKSPSLVTSIVYAITVEERYRPDATYLLNLKPNCASDDAVSVTLSNGFLSHIGSTNADQTGAVIETALKTASQAFLLTAGFPAAGDVPDANLMKMLAHRNVNLTDATKVPATPRTLNIDEEVDPGNADAWQALQYELLQGWLNLDILSSDSAHPDFPANASLPSTNNAGGIYYRPLRPYVVRFSSLSSVNQTTALSKVVLLPQPAPVFYPIERSAFVTNFTALDFQNGVLTSIALTKPSSLLAAAKIPLDIVSAILSIPTNLIQLKINTANQGSSLDTARAAQLNAELALAQSNAAVALWAATNNAAKADKTSP